MSLEVTIEQYDAMSAALRNTSGRVPLARRFRTLFTLRGIATPRAIDIIGQAFDGAAALLGHELAYCLGQIGSDHALPALVRVLEDQRQHPMVRHEAAEAMGAISSPQSIPILKRYLGDPHENVSVRETCEIAIAKIEYDHGLGAQSKGERSRFNSIDPAPPTSMHDTHTELTNTPSDPASISKLEQQLLDSSLSMFVRYRAMFALRNTVVTLSEQNAEQDKQRQAVEALAAGFTDSSALFRHEVAYIFGQLCSPLSVPALVQVLQNETEDEMVRHEAAEALGGIASDGGVQCLAVLKEWAHKPDCPQVVRESCEVALDMWAHEQEDQFVSLEDSIRIATEAGREVTAAA